MLRTVTWLDSLGLDMAIHKTELLMLTGRHIPLLVDISIGHEVIGAKNSVRYLGIRLDPRLKFLYLVQYSANKAQKIVRQLSILAAEYWKPATGVTKTPVGSWKQQYALLKRNLGRNARC